MKHSEYKGNWQKAAATLKLFNEHNNSKRLELVDESLRSAKRQLKNMCYWYQDQRSCIVPLEDQIADMRALKLILLLKH